MSADDDANRRRTNCTAAELATRAPSPFNYCHDSSIRWRPRELGGNESGSISPASTKSRSHHHQVGARLLASQSLKGTKKERQSLGPKLCVFLRPPARGGSNSTSRSTCLCAALMDFLRRFPVRRLKININRRSSSLAVLISSVSCGCSCRIVCAANSGREEVAQFRWPPPPPRPPTNNSATIKIILHSASGQRDLRSPARGRSEIGDISPVPVVSFSHFTSRRAAAFSQRTSDQFFLSLSLL